MSNRIAIALTIVGALLWAVPSPAAHAAGPGSTSASYAIQRSSLSAGAEASASTSFVLTPTIGQELVIGTSASPRFVIQSGFWSWIGSGLVPVLLSVDRGIDPEAVDLSWSGTNDPYEVFQATNCDAVFGAPLTTTVANLLDEVGTASGGLTCFNVLATAPGPLPPQIP